MNLGEQPTHGEGNCSGTFSYSILQNSNEWNLPLCSLSHFSPDVLTPPLNSEEGGRWLINSSSCELERNTSSQSRMRDSHLGCDWKDARWAWKKCSYRERKSTSGICEDSMLRELINNTALLFIGDSTNRDVMTELFKDYILALNQSLKRKFAWNVHKNYHGAILDSFIDLSICNGTDDPINMHTAFRYYPRFFKAITPLPNGLSFNIYNILDLMHNKLAFEIAAKGKTMKHLIIIYKTVFDNFEQDIPQFQQWIHDRRNMSTNQTSLKFGQYSFIFSPLTPSKAHPYNRFSYEELGRFLSKAVLKAQNLVSKLKTSLRASMISHEILWWDTFSPIISVWPSLVEKDVCLCHPFKSSSGFDGPVGRSAVNTEWIRHLLHIISGLGNVES